MCDGAAVPHVLFVGPRKTGTTWIHESLQADERVSLPRMKETFFFDREHHRGCDWYAAQFDAARERRVEAGASYFRSDLARARIAALTARPHVVVTLREPVARLVSVYNHERRRGRVVDDLGTFLAGHDDLVARYGYADGIAAWRDAVGPGRLHFVESADMAARPAEVLAAVYRLLDLPPPAAGGGPSRPAYQAKVASRPAVARLATRAARALHHVGLSGVVESLKARGADRLYLTGADGGIDEAIERDLRARFREDVERTRALTGLELAGW